MVGVISNNVAFNALQIQLAYTCFEIQSFPSMHSEKYLKNRGSKSVPLYVPLMKDLPIIPPYCRIFKSLFTHLTQYFVTSFQIENGLYCLNKVNSNRQLRGYPQFIFFAQETCYSYLIVSFLSISDFNYFTAD